MGDQKNMLWLVGSVVVLAVLFWLVSKPALGPGANPSPSNTPTPQATVRRSVPPAPANSPLPESYNQALAKYTNRRFQFDAYCQTTPRSISMNNGESVMIDNRSGDARTFAVGGVFFSLPGYGWKIFTPAAAKLPATIYVDCGSARNVGTIILQ